MMDFGWKKKTERLRMTILSAAHQIAKELPLGISKMLAIYARVAQGGDGRGLREEMETVIAAHPDEPKPLWEPLEIYGWKIQATLYLRDGKLWWLAHGVLKSEREPSAKQIAILDKILEHLGAEPRRHMIIGPASSPIDEERLAFGWWTWQNHAQLYEIQLNKDKKRDADKLRIVPLGTRETDGYTSLRVGDDEEAE